MARGEDAFEERGELEADERGLLAEAGWATSGVELRRACERGDVGGDEAAEAREALGRSVVVGPTICDWLSGEGPLPLRSVLLPAVATSLVVEIVKGLTSHLGERLTETS